MVKQQLTDRALRIGTGRRENRKIVNCSNHTNCTLVLEKIAVKHNVGRKGALVK